MRAVALLAAVWIGIALPAPSVAAPEPVSVLVVKATWGPTPFTDPAVQSAIFDEAAAFLATASFGRVQITGTQTPWLDAYPGPQSCPTANDSPLYTDANRAAAAAGFDTAAYGRVIYLTPQLSCTASSGSPITRSVVLNGQLSGALAAHELGHTFGMGHAGAFECTNDVHVRCTRDQYGAPWDIMGSGAGDPGALQKASAGWLTTNRYVAVPGTYTLDALEKPSTLTQALVVRVAGRELWIDHREPIGNDAYLRTSIWHAVTAGIAVHEAPPGAATTPFYERGQDYMLANGGHGSWIAGRKPFTIPGVLEIDVAAHVGTTVRVHLKWLDRSAPVAPVPRVAGTQVTWPAAADKGTGVEDYRVTVDGAARTSASPSLDISGLIGTHTIRVVAVDYAGNASKPATLTFTR